MELLRRIVHDPRTERFIMALIIFNAVTLGLETSPTIMAQWGTALHLIDTIVISIFVIEIIARIAVQRLAFFRDGWNLFDFIVVAVTLLPTEQTDAFTVLRALRVLRLLRLITVVPSLRRVVGGLIGALPGMGSIVLLIGLIYYVGAVMATNLFGADFAQQFGTLPNSLFTLFQVMTLENWVDGVVKPIMEKYPYAWLFFIPFIIVTSFTILNLFIGVIVGAMQQEVEKVAAQERAAERDIMHQETAPLVAEIRALKDEVAAMRREATERR
jgi:voltage-gated sodium channel